MHGLGGGVSWPVAGSSIRSISFWIDLAVATMILLQSGPAAAWDRPLQTQDRSCTVWCARISDWTIGWHQDGSRERSVNAGAHRPRPPAPVRPQRPYQFNCTFTARHPETGGANGSESERHAARQLPLIRQDARLRAGQDHRAGAALAN